MTVIASLSLSAQGLTQERPTWAASVVAGPSSYVLVVGGWTFAAAMHFSWFAAPAVVVEPGLTYLSYKEFSRRATYIFPEVSVQVGVPGGPLRPYFGIGPGLGVRVSGSGDTHLSLHAVLGLRVPLAHKWSIRGELRVRGLLYQQDILGTADFMFGLSRRIS